MKKKEGIFISILLLLFAVIVILLETGNISYIETFAYGKIYNHINNNFTIFVKLITNIGGPIVISLVCLGLLLYSKTRKSYGILSIITVILAFISNFILKNIFIRPRPSEVLKLVTETSYSFPSAHSMINTALYMIIVFLILSKEDCKKRRILLSVLFLILILGIGISRVYLGAHYFGDVVAGWILGTLVALIVYIVYKHIVIKSK